MTRSCLRTIFSGIKSSAAVMLFVSQFAWLQNAAAGDADYCIEFGKSTSDHWTKTFSGTTIKNNCNRTVNVRYCSMDDESPMACKDPSNPSGGEMQVPPGKKLPAMVGNSIYVYKNACFAPRTPVGNVMRVTSNCE